MASAAHNVGQARTGIRELARLLAGGLIDPAIARESSLDCRAERLIQIGDQIVGMFQPDRQTQ